MVYVMTIVPIEPVCWYCCSHTHETGIRPLRKPRALAGTLLFLLWGSRVAQRSKALYLSARGVTIVPGSIPGCFTSGRVWESRRAEPYWPGVVRVCPVSALIVNKNMFFSDIPS